MKMKWKRRCPIASLAACIKWPTTSLTLEVDQTPAELLSAILYSQLILDVLVKDYLFTCVGRVVKK